jgi:hypothetical protein
METKKCNKCNSVLPIYKFNKHPSTADRTQNQCRNCRNELQREYRKERGGDIKTIVYEKTKKGFLVRCYRNMMSRVNGVQKKKSYLYEGLPILDKHIFYDWSLNDESFNKLFDEWKSNNFERKICPSIDRINSKYGYELRNIRWITFSQNCILGNMNKINKK